MLSSVKISLRLICGVDFELGVPAAAGSSGSCCPYLPLAQQASNWCCLGKTKTSTSEFAGPISFDQFCCRMWHCLPMKDQKILRRAGKLLCWWGINPSLILRCHLWQSAILSRPRSHVQKPQRIQQNPAKSSFTNVHKISWARHLILFDALSWQCTIYLSLAWR